MIFHTLSKLSPAQLNIKFILNLYTHNHISEKPLIIDTSADLPPRVRVWVDFLLEQFRPMKR